MCDAIVVSAAIAFASAASQAQTASKTRERSENFRNWKESQERDNARRAEAVAAGEIHQQQLADAQQAAKETQANEVQARAAMATATTIAGEVGAFGLSYQALIADFSREKAEFELGVDTNLAIRNEYARLGLQAAKLGRQARFINASQQPLPRPNYANYAISGLGTFFSVYSGASAVQRGLK